MPPKKAWSEKNQPKILFFTTSEKENPRTQVQPEANEPIEVDDDVSHEASKNKESFSPFGPVYTRG
jgi:hypothetical protein